MVSRDPNESKPRGLIKAIKARIDAELSQPVFQRDPEYIARHLPTVEKIVQYFRPEVRGYQRVPRGRQLLLVGNHNGGLYTPEMYVFMASWLRERAADLPVYGLAHDLLFATPIRNFARKMGAIPASMVNAHRAFDLGASVMVYPGGDYECFRPFWHRQRIDFGRRQGFVRLALQRRVPVVPVVSYGSHESTFVVSRGDWIARRFGLDRFNLKIFPFVLSVPWGLTPGFVPSIPMPTKITTELCEPLDWTHYGPEAAEDTSIVNRCYDEIVGTMQATLDRIARERPYPLLDWGRPAPALAMAS